MYDVLQSRNGGFDGIDGYKIPADYKPYSSLTSEWHKEKRPNYLDSHIRSTKRQVTDKYYNVSGNLAQPKENYRKYWGS